MSRIDEIAVEASVNMLRGVPWGPSREALLAEASKRDGQASFERGWDNYSTAASLEWTSELYRLAAEARFPREGDTAVKRMRTRIMERLSEIVRSVPLDSDVGERTRVFEAGVSSAIPCLDEEDLCVIADELAAEGLLEDDPEFWKASRAEARLPCA